MKHKSACSGSSRKHSCPRQTGIVLILVSGILTMMVLLSVFLMQESRHSSAWALAQGGLVQTRLVVESGLAYAHARLTGDATRPPEAGEEWTRGDDWFVRGDESAVRPSRLSNPSYSHGEGWADVTASGNWEGAYDGGVNGDNVSGWKDLDGDGRFSAWTGRLRQADVSRNSSRFSLLIRSHDSLVCINSGELGLPEDDHDLDGLLNRDDPDYGIDLNDSDFDGIPEGNGIDDWRDPDFAGNRHLVNMLDNLGITVGLPAREVLWGPYGNPTRFDTSAPLQRPVCKLGRLVVSNRPRGGYQAVSDLMGFLPKDVFESLKTFVSAYGELIPVGFSGRPIPSLDMWSPVTFMESRFEKHARVDLNTAPPAVLTALLSNLVGTPFSSSAGMGFQPPVRLQASEVESVVHEILRARPFHSWEELMEALESAEDFFVMDSFDVGMANQEDPLQTVQKQNLVVAQFRADQHFADPYIQRHFLPLTRLDGSGRTAAITSSKDLMGAPLTTYPYNAQGENSPQAPLPLESRITTEGRLDGAVSSGFSVFSESFACDSAEHRRSAQIDIRRERTVRVAGQQDFEQLLGVGPLPARWDFPGGDACYAGLGQATREGIQSFPRFPITSACTGGLNYSPSSVPRTTATPAEVARAQRYPRSFGGLHLSAFQCEERVPWFPSLYSMPMDEDRFPVPDYRWDPQNHADNFFSPMSMIFPTSASEEKFGSLPIQVIDRQQQQLKETTLDKQFGFAAFHAGCVMGPLGPRLDAYALDRSVKWIHGGGTGRYFPLPRGTFDAYFAPDANPQAEPKGEIASGVAEFWYPARGIEGKDGGEWSFEILFGDETPQQAPMSYFKVTPGENGGVAVAFSPIGGGIGPGGGPGGIGPGGGLGGGIGPGGGPGGIGPGGGPGGGQGSGKAKLEVPAASAACAWHHVAFVFDATLGGPQDTTSVTGYIDGELAVCQIGGQPANQPFDIGMDPDVPIANPTARLLLLGSLQDVGFYPSVLPNGNPDPDVLTDVRTRAQRGMFVDRGRYVSRSLAFDPGRLPEGVEITGFSWDGFIPPETGGTVTFTLTGNHNGVIATRSAGFDPSSGGKNVVFETPLLAETATLAVDIACNPGAWPWRIQGQPVLQDTPFISEVVLHYRPRGDSPRIVGYSGD